ncbi:MAG TPA: monofunctional biosynthetic peptidoglycan transglycosylase [Hyphomicrobiales bacterium]|nr:monofunctional biosynthetic peptidoglycan transglycosylase [Hyphomicrobiales bacterium]
MGDNNTAAASRRKHPRGKRLVRIARIAAMVLAVLIVLPFLLVPVYAVVNPPVSTLMLWRLLEGRGISQQWVDLANIAPALPATVIMTEDGRFCEHHGVDWEAVQQVVEEAGEGGEPRGASTIPMQTAKNLFLWPHRSYLRKLLEIPLAYWLDLVWSKQRIIEVYLNVVEFGPGIYGAEAAARHHFGKDAKRLTGREAGLLAAVLPNPIARSASRPGPVTRRLARRAERRGRAAGAYIECIR